MKSVSEYLKSRREELNLSIVDVSYALNVRPEYISAIEREDEKPFVSDVYRKGFVKLYARYLGLNEEYALALDRRTHKIDLNKGVVNLEKKNFYETVKFRFSAISLLILIFLISIGYFIYIQAEKYNSYPSLYLKQPINQEYKASNEDEFNIVYNSSVDIIDIVGKVDPEIKVYVNQRLQSIDTLGEFTIKNKVLFNGVNRFVFEVENKIGKKTIVNLTINYNQSL